jgi:hypothetical protein
VHRSPVKQDDDKTWDVVVSYFTVPLKQSAKWHHLG